MPIKHIFKILRDKIWPVMEDEAEDPQKVEVNWISNGIKGIEDKNKINEIYNLAHEIYKAEHERYEGITRKTISIFGATGIISAIVLGLGRFIFMDVSKSSTIIVIIMAILFIIILLYLSRAIHFCLKTMETTTFWIISPREICITNLNNVSEYLKTLSIIILEYTERNYRVTNQKIDKYVLAYEYYKLAIYTLVLLGVFIGTGFFFN